MDIPRLLLLFSDHVVHREPLQRLVSPFCMPWLAHGQHRYHFGVNTDLGPLCSVIKRMPLPSIHQPAFLGRSERKTSSLANSFRRGAQLEPGARSTPEPRPEIIVLLPTDRSTARFILDLEPPSRPCPRQLYTPLQPSALSPPCLPSKRLAAHRLHNNGTTLLISSCSSSMNPI